MFNMEGSYNRINCLSTLFISVLKFCQFYNSFKVAILKYSSFTIRKMAETASD